MIIIFLQKSKGQLDDMRETLASKIEEAAVVTKKNERLEKKVKEVKRDLSRAQKLLQKGHEEVVETRIENKKFKESLRVGERFVLKL